MKSYHISFMWKGSSEIHQLVLEKDACFVATMKMLSSLSRDCDYVAFFACQDGDARKMFELEC